MSYKRTDKVRAFIERVKTVPKQNAHLSFDEPEMPKFMVEELENGDLKEEATETQTQDPDEILDEVVEEHIEEGDNSKGKVKLVSENPSDYDTDSVEWRAEGLVFVADFGMSQLLGVMNEEDAEEYELDETETNVLVRDFARIMQKRDVTISPEALAAIDAAIIWGKGLIPGIVNVGRRVANWFRNRKVRSNKAHIEAQRIATEEAKKAQIAKVNEEMRKENERLRAELEAKEAKPSNSGSVTKPSHKQKASVKAPAKVPTLEELRKSHKDGKCVYPGCGKDRGSNKHFCSREHRAAYVAASQRKTNPYPKTSEI